MNGPELRNLAGQVVDRLEFSNRPPCPKAPMAGRLRWSESVHRLGDAPSNWAGSPLTEDAKPSTRRAHRALRTQPIARDGLAGISEVSFSNSIPPQQTIQVEACKARLELEKVVLLYRVIEPGSAGEGSRGPG